MVDKHRVNVLNSGETTRLEQVTERISKEKQNIAKELRDIQNARLLFEANKRSKQEQKRLSSEQFAKPQSFQYMQNSIRNDVGPITSHRRSPSTRLFSNSSRSSSHNDLLRMKNDEISTRRQAGRRTSLMNKSDGWTLSSSSKWLSNQGSLNRFPKRRISLPTAAPVTCGISSNSDKWNKDDVLDNTASGQHMSKSSSNRLIPSNWSVSCSEESLRKALSKQPRSPAQNKNWNLPQESTETDSSKTLPCCTLEEEYNEFGSEESLGKAASSSCQKRNARPRSLRSGGRNKNWNLPQESPEVNLKETPFCPFEEENNDVDSKDLSVMSDYVYRRGQEGSSEDTKLKLPVIAMTSRSPSSLSHTDNHGNLSVTDMHKKRRKISPSSMTRSPFHSKKEHVDSGQQEVGIRVFTPAERRSSIKRQKAMASIEIERLTRSKEELDQAMMSKFKRIGVGEMGHMVLRKESAKLAENMESMESPWLINIHGKLFSLSLL